jgi:FliI/YscN family ATPase
MSDGAENDPILSPIQQRIATFQPTTRCGHVTGIAGTVIRAVVPDVGIGELCRITSGGRSIYAEVIGFDRQDVILMPYGHLTGIAGRSDVIPVGHSLTVPAGQNVSGRVINALGQPLDGRGPIDRKVEAPLMSRPPNPLLRGRINQPVQTGVRAIDALMTIGKGQRVGIFAAAGVGKSTLLGMIARHVKADRVVVALIGERGREVNEFLQDSLGGAGLAKATVVVSTSDEPALLRARAAYAATAIAEAARARGEHVVLMMDSVTRFARALREIGLATGEPPGPRGFPASVYAALPMLFERAGNDQRGSITALYTVLVAGDDLKEPVADESISLLDGHLVLSRRLAERGQYPALSIPESISRVMPQLVSEQHLKAAAIARRILGLYEQNYDKISTGFYDPDSEEERRLVARVGDVNRFVAQLSDESADFQSTQERLVREFGA